MHVRMLPRIKRVLPRRVVLIDLGLQAVIHIWMRQKTICEACERE